MSVRIHPTAIVEELVQIGDGTSIWDHAHIRREAVIGEQCIVGGKSLIACGVQIGNRVKINSNAYICTGVTLLDGVMVSAGVIFTNDRFPRATTPDLTQLRSSEPDEHTLTTLVREGATIGAGCIIGCNLEIGRFAMIGMGSVVTRSIPDFCLAIGSPARIVGVVCRCGEPVHRFSNGLGATKVSSQQALHDNGNAEATCGCGLRYRIDDDAVVELDDMMQRSAAGDHLTVSGCTRNW